MSAGEDRLETVEIAILIFVILGVIVKSGLGEALWLYLLPPFKAPYYSGYDARLFSHSHGCAD